MNLTIENIGYLSYCLEGFFFGDLSQICSTTVTAPLSKEVSVLGLYSGVFAMYLQYHSLSAKGADNARQTFSYALCVLYALAVAFIAFDIVIFVAVLTSVHFSTSRLSAMQTPDLNMSTVYRLGSIVQPIMCGFCDFIGQSILVRTTGDNAYPFNLFI